MQSIIKESGYIDGQCAYRVKSGGRVTHSVIIKWFYDDQGRIQGEFGLCGGGQGRLLRTQIVPHIIFRNR